MREINRKCREINRITLDGIFPTSAGKIPLQALGIELPHFCRRESSLTSLTQTNNIHLDLFNRFPHPAILQAFRRLGRRLLSAQRVIPS